MKPIGPAEEHSFSLEVAAVKINLVSSGSIDSFSSNLNSNFNQGAARFITILENHMDGIRNVDPEEALEKGL